MNKLLTLLFILSLVGCGKTSIDPELQPYVNNFMALGNIQEKFPLTVQFGNSVSAESDGDCVYGSGTNMFANTVNIVRVYWDTYSETKRMLLMYHELGHCVLNRAHNSELKPDGKPYSIMYPISTASSLDFQANPAPYLLELFSIK